MMRLYLPAVFGLLLTGCAGEPAAPTPLPPTLVNVQVDCGTNVNPGNDGAASPVMLRLYELREPSSFKTADFFDLFNDDKAVLAGDLAQKSEMLLKPGETKSLTIQPDSTVHSFGAFAAFRQLDDAQWRGVVEVTEHQTQTVNIKLDRNRLSMDKP
ncbi:MAG: type VI secretion system lipoprotein TssJ [Gammaproteobacteria bacterium]